MNLSSTNFGASFSDNRLIADSLNVSINLFKIYNVYNFVADTFFVLPTIFGNILVLVALGYFQGLRKPVSGVLIGNLAIADLLVGLFVFPLDMMIRIRRQFFNYSELCLVFYCLVYTVVGTSVLNLFLLSLERFHAIVFPLRHRVIFTRRRINITIVLVWVLTFSFGFLPMFGWRLSVDEDTFICGAVPILPKTYTRMICSMLVLSLTLNTIFFFIIAKVAMRAAQSFADLNITEEEHDRMRKNIRHTKMMLIVSGLFIVFWAPYSILSLVPDISPLIHFVRSWLSSLGLINSAMNWIVYGCRSKKFRLAFKAILTCKCSRGKAEISSICA